MDQSALCGVLCRCRVFNRPGRVTLFTTSPGRSLVSIFGVACSVRLDPMGSCQEKICLTISIGHLVQATRF